MQDFWDKAYESGKDYTLISSSEIDVLLRHADSSNKLKKILDIGCGTGQLTRELFHRGYITVGIDSSINAIKIAQSSTCVDPQYMTYLHADIEKPDTIELHAPFGLIICKLTYAFIRDKKRLIENVKKWLLPGGVFVVITPVSDDIPEDKAEIAANSNDISLLRKNFVTLEYFKQRPGKYLLTYFIGRKK